MHFLIFFGRGVAFFNGFVLYFWGAFLCVAIFNFSRIFCCTNEDGFDSLHDKSSLDLGSAVSSSFFQSYNCQLGGFPIHTHTHAHNFTLKLPKGVKKARRGQQQLVIKRWQHFLHFYYSSIKTYIVQDTTKLLVNKKTTLFDVETLCWHLITMFIVDIMAFDKKG